MRKLVYNYVPRLPVRRGGQRYQSFPRAVRRLMLSKRKAWKRWKAAPNKTNKSVFNNASRQYRKAARLFLANQENNLLQVGSQKFFTLSLTASAAIYLLIEYCVRSRQRPVKRLLRL